MLRRSGREPGEPSATTMYEELSLISLICFPSPSGTRTNFCENRQKGGHLGLPTVGMQLWQMVDRMAARATA
eukprot:3832262-Prymnesium_polylepis.1